MWQLYLPIVIAVLYYGLRYFLTNRNNFWKKRKVAGPKPTLLFGNTSDFNFRKKNMAVVIKEMYDEFPEEKVIGFFRMLTPTLLVRDLDILKHILIKDFDHFTDRGFEFSSEGLGQNLFHADGDNWKGLRTRFTPVFTSGKLKNMFYLLADRGDQFMEYLEDQCQRNNEHEVHSLVQKYTISSICACAFGVDLDTLGDEVDTLALLDRLILTPNLLFDLDMVYPGLLRKLNLSLFPAKVQNFFSDLVSRISAERNGKPSDRNDFMDLILALREMREITYSHKSENQKVVEITDGVIAAQAFVFYVAGYETSATTMSYLLYEIALQPEIQEKLANEIIEVTDANDGHITYDSLKDMKYLDKVFDETLRKHSIVDPLQRVAKHDYKLPGTDIEIKKGELVMISVRGIHYDEKYYPNPELFDPERFAPEVAGIRHLCAYLPFGAGPRNCIGMRFGKLQSRLLIAKLLCKYRVEPTMKTPKTLGITKNRLIVGPEGGVHLKFVPRY